jgi:hypothetical protein
MNDIVYILRDGETTVREVLTKRPPAPPACFPGTAQVTTPIGRKQIGQLAQGDVILSYTRNGSLVESQVTSVQKYSATSIFSLKLTDRTIRTTDHHTFLSTRGWLRANQLRVGDQLTCVDKQGRSYQARVEGFSTEPAEPVYNIHTTGEHNFIADGVVAHNFTEFRRLRTLFHRLFIDPWFTRGRQMIEAVAD